MGIATVKKAGTDAFCKYSFAGGKPIKTKVVTRQGTSRLEINPEFNYELWYPVSVPTMTQVSVVSLLIILMHVFLASVVLYWREYRRTIIVL